MDSGEHLEPLRRVLIFHSVTDPTLELVAASCQFRRYSSKQFIVGHLDDSDDVYFIAEGRARVRIYSSSGRVVGFRNLRAGDMFGEFAAIDGAPRSASIEAETKCLVAVMKASAFRRLITTEPSIALAVMKHFVGQLRTLTARVVEFSTLPVNTRIEVELLRLAEEDGADILENGNSARIAEPPTHVELAGRISTHREAVTRHLSQLDREGLFQRAGRAWILSDLAALRARVEDAVAT